MVILRPHQREAKRNIYALWASGARNVLAVQPTGSGKTAIFAEIIREHNGASCAIAHRNVLVGQISMALARVGVRHRIIGPNDVIRHISHQHQLELGRSYYDGSAMCAVAGVDTLKRRAKQLARWLPQVTLWVQDEAHHVLRGNKWGDAVGLFPNAKGLGVTATPIRTAGEGLGRHADGLFDAMDVGPSARELIDRGYLTDYRIFAPPSDLDLDGVKITDSGDYSRKQLRQRVQGSHIVGDVVTHYQRLAPGKLGATFVDSVETASGTAQAYRDAGVPAEVITADTPTNIRYSLIKKFEAREILQLVNVDLFGEGFDLPAIEVVSMARPTQSYSLYAQQFGRALRLMVHPNLSAAWDSYTDEQRRALISQGDKPYAIIIDHVGNFIRHGRPDTHRAWSLDPREKRGKATRDPDDLPIKSCPRCTGAYEAFRAACPYCGYKPVPARRSAPEYVDGDLVELDPDTLSAMASEVARIDGPVRIPPYAAPSVAANMRGQHLRRQKAQEKLRRSIAWWAGVHRALGYDLSESYKIFYHRFGFDVLSAQALGRPGAEALCDRVWTDITRLTDKYKLTGVYQYDP